VPVNVAEERPSKEPLITTMFAPQSHTHESLQPGRNIDPPMSPLFVQSPTQENFQRKNTSKTPLLPPQSSFQESFQQRGGVDSPISPLFIQSPQLSSRKGSQMDSAPPQPPVQRKTKASNRTGKPRIKRRTPNDRLKLRSGKYFPRSLDLSRHSLSP